MNKQPQNMTTMRRLFFFFIFSLLLGNVFAQTSPKAKARVTEIKKLYAEAKESMAYNDQEDYPAVSGMETTYYYMAPGAGPIKHYVKYDMSTEDIDHEGGLAFIPYFVSDSYNSGGRKLYEEYLLDEKTGKPIFAYVYEENGDGTKNEGRYYYYADGSLAHKDVKFPSKWGTFFDEKYVKTKAERLRKAFQFAMP